MVPKFSQGVPPFRTSNLGSTLRALSSKPRFEGWLDAVFDAPSVFPLTVFEADRAVIAQFAARAPRVYEALMLYSGADPNCWQVCQDLLEWVQRLEDGMDNARSLEARVPNSLTPLQRLFINLHCACQAVDHGFLEVLPATKHSATAPYFRRVERKGFQTVGNVEAAAVGRRMGAAQ